MSNRSSIHVLLAIAALGATALTSTNAFAMCTFCAFHPAIGGSQGEGSANRSLVAHRLGPSSVAPRIVVTASHSFVNQSFHLANRSVTPATTSHSMASHVPSNFSTTPEFHEGPLAGLHIGSSDQLHRDRKDSQDGQNGTLQNLGSVIAGAVAGNGHNGTGPNGSLQSLGSWLGGVVAGPNQAGASNPANQAGASNPANQGSAGIPASQGSAGTSAGIPPGTPASQGSSSTSPGIPPSQGSAGTPASQGSSGNSAGTPPSQGGAGTPPSQGSGNPSGQGGGGYPPSQGGPGNQANQGGSAGQAY